MRPAHLLPAILLLVPLWLSAQTSPPAEKGLQPHILIDTVGPDGWRMRLGPTNVGSLLESEKGRELWEPHLEPFFGLWQQLAGDAGAYAASRTRLLGYGGRVRVALWLDPTTPRHSKAPATCIAVVLDSDGRSDLGAIAKDLRATLYQAIPGEWADIEIDGTQITVRKNDDMSVTAPMLDGDQVIIAASDDDLAVALRRARALAASATEKIKPNSPALRVRFDFGAILAATMDQENEKDRAMMKASGLDTIGTGTVTLSTAGPRLQLEYTQSFTDDDRGLFGALLPATASIPSLLLAAPDSGTWTVGHFDCLKLYESVLDALVAGDMTADGDPRDEIKEELGIDPAKDLLAHMTDDVLFCLAEVDDFDEPFDRVSWTLAFRLKDEDAFRKGLFALIPKAKPFLQREAKETHGDVDVYRYGNMLGYDIWLAVGRSVFVLAGGRNAEDRMVEMLDRCVDLPAELPADRQLPKGFESLTRYLPPGCHGYSVGDARNVVSLPTGLWYEMLGIFTPLPNMGVTLDPDEDAERREALDALLKEHRLDIARSATGYSNRTWRWRLYW